MMELTLAELSSSALMGLTLLANMWRQMLTADRFVYLMLRSQGVQLPIF